MAKKRKTAKRYFRARTSSAKVSRRRRSSSSSYALNPMKIALFGALYGAVRPYLAQAISPVTSKIPMGAYVDEAGMIVISYFAAKGTFGNQFKEAGKAGLYIESAVIGSDIITGKFTSALSGVSTSTSTPSLR